MGGSGWPLHSQVLGFLGSWPGRATAVAALILSAILSPTWLQGGSVLCPLRRTTGLMCPGCGLSRSFVSLSHGDLANAFHFHAFGPLVYLIFVASLVWMIVPGRLRPAPDHAGLTWLWRVGSTVVVAAWLLWWAACRLLLPVL
jgi:hypothetical protein